MALPISNFATNFVASNTGFCQLIAKDVSLAPAAQIGIAYSAPMFDLVSWHITGGSTGAGTIVAFQELGADGVWRVMGKSQTLANSADTNGILNGPFHGVRMILNSTISGNGVGFAEMKASIRQM